MSEKRYTIEVITLTDWAVKIQSVLEAKKMLESAKELYSKMLDEGSVYTQNKCRFDERLYPRLPSHEEFDGPGMAGLIDEDGYLTKQALSLLKGNSLAQLLYAIAWKNGDLKKFHPIKNGLLDENLSRIGEVKNNSYVFYQFGRHLKDNANSIIDQHTVRGILLYEKLSKKGDSFNLSLEKIRNIKKPTKGSFNHVVEWLNNSLQNQSIESRFYVDRILFMFGKLASREEKKAKDQNQ